VIDGQDVFAARAAVGEAIPGIMIGRLELLVRFVNFGDRAAKIVTLPIANMERDDLNVFRVGVSGRIAPLG
jgi:hypothetical protein